MNDAVATADAPDGVWIITDHVSANLLPPGTWCCRFLLKPGEPQWEDSVDVTVSDDGRHLFLQNLRSNGGLTVDLLYQRGAEVFPDWQVAEFIRRRPGRPELRKRLNRTRKSSNQGA